MTTVQTRRVIDFVSKRLPCCYFNEFDYLIVSGKITNVDTLMSKGWKWLQQPFIKLTNPLMIQII